MTDQQKEQILTFFRIECEFRIGYVSGNDAVYENFFMKDGTSRHISNEEICGIFCAVNNIQYSPEVLADFIQLKIAFKDELIKNII
jgi:hypothetical protein